MNWEERDRAVYVVSTLNAPLCKSGRQLSTVLWTKDGARLFDVLKSTVNGNLYYIQVRTASKTLLGVYAYEFGWKFPTGVRSYHCVAKAQPGIVKGYGSKAWRFIARFRTTYPQN